MRRLARSRLLWAVVAVTGLLGGCGGELQTPGEALRIFDQSLPEAFLNEQYDAPVRAVGGLRPYEFNLQEGELPAGLELSGGMIRGVPGETGTFEFTIAVSDANLSQTFNDYRLSVVERPPPELSLSLPQTEIREPTTVRLRVQDASELRAVSALLEWDPEILALEGGSVTAERRNSALLVEAGEGFVQIDLAALGDDWNGELTLARFRLVPTEALVPDVTLSALLLDDRGGRHLQGTPAASGVEGAEGVQDATPDAGEDVGDDVGDDVGEESVPGSEGTDDASQDEDSGDSPQGANEDDPPAGESSDDASPGNSGDGEERP